MTTTDPATTAPEPGQRVLIPAVVGQIDGFEEGLALFPIRTDGKDSVGIALDWYVWRPADVPPPGYAELCRAIAALADKTMRRAQYRSATGASPTTNVQDLEETARAMLALIPDKPPADVPPQPPVLAEGMTVRVAGDDGLWIIDEADLTPHACLWLTEVAAAEALDHRPAPVQATTHGEAGEAQEGAQAAPRVANSSTGANGSLPAVQGAGRDWRGEIVAIRLAHRMDAHSHCSCGWEPPDYADVGVAGQEAAWEEHVAGFIVAALGLHDLEQAAAEVPELRRMLAIEQTQNAADVAIARDRAAGYLREMNRLRDDLGRALGHDPETIGYGTDPLLVEVEQQRLQVRLRIDERDAARRELEQLRGEVERIRVDLPAIAGRQPGAWGVANELDNLLTAALAATAPATQDGDPA